MAKIMRIVEPHVYEEFLTYLRKPSCSCAGDGAAADEKGETLILPPTVNDSNHESEAEQAIVIPTEEDTSCLNLNEEPNVLHIESSSSVAPDVETVDVVPSGSVENLHGGRPNNWLSIEGLYMKPYKKKKLPAVRRTKGGKRKKKY